VRPVAKCGKGNELLDMAGEILLLDAVPAGSPAARHDDTSA
jgi:hypothetical protein